MPRQQKSTKYKVCCFCNLSEDNELKFGKFCEYNDIVTHYYCLLLSSNMQQRGNDDEGILGFLEKDIKKEIRRGKRLVCIYCKKSGATLRCCHVKCKQMFHFPCGLTAGTLNQFFGQFRSYCVNHRPKQKIAPQLRKELARIIETICYICYENVNPHDRINTIWAPCCKKNAWFHRQCVQQLAVSAGYFFKCPLCNDKKRFQGAMLQFGIFVPSQDASWELVPNAFQELLYRHDQCDAPKCLCPKGRKYTSFNAKWELVLCRTCGSQGIHMACGQLKWVNPFWECDECVSILGKSAGSPCSSRTKGTLPNTGFDSDDSDSDISVGKDSPVPFGSTEPFINSTPNNKPGPRSFKLRQRLRGNEKVQEYTKENGAEKANGSTGSLQPTSNGKMSTRSSSCSLPSTRLNGIKGDSTVTAEHSKSKLYNSAESVIMLDSDDEIMEESDAIKINDCHSLKDSLVIDSNNGAKKTVLFYNSTSLHIEKVSPRNNLRQNVSVEVTRLRSPRGKKHDPSNNNGDSNSVANIKITNVVSLADEQQWENNNNNNNNNNSNSTLPNDASGTNLKRKFDENTSGSTSSSRVNIPKRLRRRKGELEKSPNDNSNGDAPVNISDLCNIMSKVETDSPHVDVKKEMTKLFENVDSTTKNCDGDAGTSPAAEIRLTDYTSDTRINKEANGGSRKEGTGNPELSGAWKSCSNVAASVPKHRSHSTKSIITCSYRRHRNQACDYHRVIPEYVQLRDLKFHVHNLNTLEMILYDKYAVNINMEDANSMIGSAKFDASTKRIGQQNIVKAQTEGATNFRSGNILQSICSTVCNKGKSKCTFFGEQLVNYEDDAKENQDPVTSTCKTAMNSVLTNGTLTRSDPCVSTSCGSTTESENKDLSQSMSKNGDEDEAENYTSLFDTVESSCNATTGCKYTYNNAKASIQSVMCSDHAANVAPETYNTKSDLENRFCDSTELISHVLNFENQVFHNHEKERGIEMKMQENTNEMNLKVSIDLNRIQHFIDNNLDLFPKYKRRDCEEQCFQEVDCVKEKLSNPDRTSDASTNLVKRGYNFALCNLDGKIGKSHSIKNLDSNGITAIEEDLVSRTGGNNNLLDGKKYRPVHTNSPFGI